MELSLACTSYLFDYLINITDSDQSSLLFLLITNKEGKTATKDSTNMVFRETKPYILEGWSYMENNVSIPITDSISFFWSHFLSYYILLQNSCGILVGVHTG